MATPRTSGRRCIVVDGNSLLYRAFFAIRFLSTRSGQPTNALFGFANMLLKVLEDYTPDLLIVAFDAPAKTFRHEEFPAYKETRKPTPDELISQFSLSRDLARSLGAVVIELPGYEADDVVGTCARQGESCGYEVIIFTGDTDELQLVTDKVTVVATTRGVSDVAVYTPNAVVERFGLTPEQFVDYKALKGDTSDNIPGVAGIGDKTASRLLAEFGSLDELMRRLDELPEGKVRTALEQSREQVWLSRRLATIVTDAPTGVDCASLPAYSRPSGEAERLFRELEFETLGRRLPPSEPAAGEPQEATAQQSMPAVERVEDEAGLAKLYERLAGQAGMGVYLETDDAGALLRIGLGAEGWGASVDIQPAGGSQGTLPGGSGGFEVSAARLGKALESKGLLQQFAIHDLKRALLTLSKYGMALPGCRHDTMLAGFLLQPGRGSYTLDWLAGQHLGSQIPDDLKDWRRTALSAALIARLAAILEASIESEGLRYPYEGIEMPLAPVLAKMEQAGIQADAGRLRAASDSMAATISALEADIFALAGTEFNIGSPKQVGSVLFEKLQLPAGKRTRTGFSTDAETLEALAPSYEICAKLLHWRELTKLKGTYADALPRLIDPATGRIHTSFNQTGAATGRLSSSDPNLQNIPIKTEAGREIRAAFVAAPGCTLLAADYSQIELRLLAHLSGDPELTRCFNEQEDIHVRTACALFGVEAHQVTADQRRRAKTINFSVIYGKSDFGLSKELGITIGEAHAYIEAYFAQYPRVREYTAEVLERARTDGYAATILGRKRWFPELHARDRNVRANAERAAFNAPLQGSAADIIKLAMIAIDGLGASFAATMVLQVHDELVFDVPVSAVEEVTKTVHEKMEGVCDLAVPLVVDVKSGPNWRDVEQ